MAQNVYTQVASSMVMLTEIVTGRLSGTPIGLSKRVLTITPPAGPSSNAGALARQPLMLSNGAEQTVCGWVDFAAAVAEVRDFAASKAGYEARYRKTFDVNEAAYRVWLQKLFAVFTELGVRATVTGEAESYAPTDPATTQPPGAPRKAAAAPSSSLVPVLVGMVLVMVGLAVAIVMLMR